MNAEQTRGIIFVGAGPGAPDLITLRAQHLIAGADVIIYAGSLVNDAVLAHARPDVMRYNSAGMPLDEQIAVMQEAAGKGQSVVRLHTGDPSIYGAIFEQIRRLDALGIPYRIVPGVSSALAAAAALGIEYTIPGSTQTVIFTRLEGRTPVPDTESLRGLAAHHTSLVIFLSTGMIARVATELRAAGYAEDTPVAVVYRASWPDELVMYGTLADIAGKIEVAELTHHALIVVSPALDARVTAATPDSHLYGTAFAGADRQDTTAIITLTRGGTHTGEKLLGLLPDAELYAPAHFVEATDRTHPYTESVRQLLQSVFQTHGVLICIMASGIVVRDLAPLLHSKHHDPGVVVLDEAGRFAVSLLGGHKGGANRLARQIASLLGGQAVLTTSSDVQDLPALDLLGQDWGWQIEGVSRLTAASAALVNGEAVGVFQDAGSEAWWPDSVPAHLTRYDSPEALCDAQPTAALIITCHDVGEIVGDLQNAIIYYPPCLSVGVGCNRGTPAGEIVAAVADTLAGARLSPRSILTLATIEDKAGEAGLLAACEGQGWPLRIFTRAEIATVEHLPNPSEWTERALGVRGVAEPAALLASGSDTLLVEKRKYGNVTVAVALQQESDR